MVPEPIWGWNLRSNDGLGKYRWGKLRQSILNARGPSCAICGSTEKPHGHEVWVYQEGPRRGIARLVEVEIVCRDCHSIHHWGVSTRLGFQGAMPIEELKRLVRHACKINNWKIPDFQRHADEAMEIWSQRSKLRWKVDWGPFREAVRDAKAARVERAIMIEKAARSPEPLAATTSATDFDDDGPSERKRSRGNIAEQRRRYRERQRAKRRGRDRIPTRM